MILRIKMLFHMFVVGYVSLAAAGPATESYQGKYCTDPRTMLQHPAYTEWADAYSCTRHRCQPGGRNLAIYTVGCKRVEPPESAIECEEVVEDTNMQFPFCCTRLRCLVVVRGEVWTRVLGQPWESLPAAPWSHMYKMKKPPPGDDPSIAHIPPVPVGAGPIYELAKPEEDTGKVLRSKSDHYEPPAQSPDIVIGLSTNHEQKEFRKKPEEKRHRRGRKNISPLLPEEPDVQNEEEEEPRRNDAEKQLEPTMPEQHSEEQEPPASVKSVYRNNHKKSTRDHDRCNSIETSGYKKNKNIEMEMTESPSNRYNEIEQEHYSVPDITQTEPKVSVLGPVEKAEAEKSGNLQALVDAIGSRMRDIEHVVRRMNDKEPGMPGGASSGSRDDTQIISEPDVSQTPHGKKMRPDGDNRRYMPTTTEAPAVEEAAIGYYSDASNAVQRSQPKAVATYMVPVETRRRNHHLAGSGSSGEEKRRKKRVHKKKKVKGHHKRHQNPHKEKRRSNRVNSVEGDKKMGSVEDNSAMGNQ